MLDSEEQVVDLARLGYAPSRVILQQSGGTSSLSSIDNNAHGLINTEGSW